MNEALQRRAGGSGEGYDSPKNLRIRGIQCLLSDGSGPVKDTRESVTACKPFPQEGSLHGEHQRRQTQRRPVGPIRRYRALSGGVEAHGSEIGPVAGQWLSMLFRHTRSSSGPGRGPVAGTGRSSHSGTAYA